MSDFEVARLGRVHQYATEVTTERHTHGWTLRRPFTHPAYSAWNALKETCTMNQSVAAAAPKPRCKAHLERNSHAKQDADVDDGARVGRNELGVPVREGVRISAPSRSKHAMPNGSAGQ
eukprot:1202285-Prymnesium_polylepis.1